MSQLKANGHKFPALRESDAMFSADSAPEWMDGNVCHRCRTQFSILNRKHHCRNCGQVFCNSCSAKNITLPKYGIEKEVRVCDNCYDQVTKPSSSSKAATENKDTELPLEYLNSSLAQQNQAPPRKTEDEIREEEELQLALALSQSEAEAKEKEKMRITSVYQSSKGNLIDSSGYLITNPHFKVTEPKVEERSPSPLDQATHPELARYLNRTFWENRQIEATDSARPTSPSAPATAPTPNSDVQVKVKENGVVDSELEDFVTTLKSQVEIFINRMKSNSSRGRSIATDSSVQTIFMNITAMHSRLLRYIQQHDDSRLYYERLQDKLTQVKDARAALDALREEHREKMRREAEEAERQRQLQMAHKLEIMRKKKQEYLQYQRQLALQRIQEQEREMQMRQEQQKQQYSIGGPYGSYMSSPVHGQQFQGPPNTAPPVGMYFPYGQPHMPPPQSAPPQMGMGLSLQGHSGGFAPGGRHPHPGQGMPGQNMQIPPGLQHPHLSMGPQVLPPGLPGHPSMGPVSLSGPLPGNIQSGPPNMPLRLNLPSGMQSGSNAPPGVNMLPGANIPSGGNVPPGGNMQSGGNMPPGGSIPSGPGIPSGSNMPPNLHGPNLQGQNMQPMMGGQIGPQQYQQPGAPPPSPQVPKNEQGGTQTAELISFD